jgi:lipopolysaccharide/colanic/teichoic acid biosynthesis glycosyltransferase
MLLSSNGKNKSLKSFEDVSNGWYAKKEFSALLLRETKRSYRTGLPLSLVLIDLAQINPENVLNLFSSYRHFLKELIFIISENTRDIDLKCLSHDSEITILLADTEIAGAKIFTEKISEAMYNHGHSETKKDFLMIINSLKISAYPMNLISGKNRLDARPIIINQLEFQPEQASKSEEKKMYRSSELHIDWTVEPAVSGALSISSAVVDHVFFQNIANNVYRFLKRVTDILGSLVGLILFIPAMLVIAAAIKITSPGPVFFNQIRISKSGRRFKLHKFRTMRFNCDDKIHRDYVKKLIAGNDGDPNFGTSDNPVYKIQDDPRITRIGHLLRQTSLDELPQFFNVLTGDMSLVGPRPPIPYELDLYKTWHHRRVFDVKPGITGLWQVYGRSVTTFDEMVRLDLQYVRRQSFILDIKIILKTFIAIFNSRGAH